MTYTSLELDCGNEGQGCCIFAEPEFGEGLECCTEKAT